MNKIFNISFQIYRLILITVLPLYFLSKFLVGVAGHNQPTSFSEYIFLCLALLALLAFVVIKKSENIFLKKCLSIFISIFVLIGIGLAFYGLFDFWILYQDHKFGLSDNIPVALIISFILVSIALFIALLKNKV